MTPTERLSRIVTLIENSGAAASGNIMQEALDIARGGPRPPSDYATPAMLAEVLDRRWSAEDVERWLDEAEKETGKRPKITRRIYDACKLVELVPNEPFRLAYEQAVTDGLFDGIEVRAKRKEPLQGATIIRRNVQDHLRAAEKEPGEFGSDNKEFGNWLTLQLGRRPKDGVLNWLMPYELAVAVTKTLGLDPTRVGV